MSIPITDAHMHIWDLQKVHYPWLEGNTTILAQNYVPADVVQSLPLANVTQAVLVQAANSLEDTDFMLAAAKTNDWISGVVGWAPLQNPEQTNTLIKDYYLKNNYLKGVRHLIHNEPNDNWLLQEEVIESLKLLAENNITYDIVGINDAHVKVALLLAEKIPNLKIVFDHLNAPPLAFKEKWNSWSDLMKQASKHKNVHAKISGLGLLTRNLKHWTADDIQPCIEFALEHFGTDKCFCGGDWPVALLAGPYEKAFGSYRSIIEKSLNPLDQEKVFNKNASSFYSL